MILAVDNGTVRTRVKRVQPLQRIQLLVIRAQAEQRIREARERLFLLRLRREFSPLNTPNRFQECGVITPFMNVDDTN